jgi:DNA-binding PucR family transcriptional regulator
MGDPCAIAIFRPSSSTASKGSTIGPEDLRRQLSARMLGADVWAGRSREGFVALVQGEDPDAKVLGATVEDLLGDDAHVGLGRAGRGVAGVRRSAQEAVRALRIGTSLRRRRRVRRYADVAVLDLVGVGTADAEAFMQAALGSLAEPGASSTYLDTLRQLSANGYRLKLAAAALSVHPHTLSYRVKQIRRRFGIDLDDPEVRLRVHLALLILDADGPASDA